MKYGMWNLGQIEALLNKVGEDNARKLLDCREVTVTFDTADKKATIAAATPELTVWKTIKIGTGIKNGKAFCSELEKKDFRIGDWACDMLGQKAFTVATQEEDVDLVRLSVYDLGFKEGARYDAICAKALELGLELCPAEVGPQLRLQYPDQPRDEWLVIAMEAIRDSGGYLGVFDVDHGYRGRWLSSDDGYLDYFWDADDRFVFRARKQLMAA
ncbi:MAG: hypothetical protein HY372_02245 [Candidatus Andersenbacteria bacterium]|nr:hypothetical protein [Candidatus Andersenbacteria bacterium]